MSLQPQISSIVLSLDKPLTEQERSILVTFIQATPALTLKVTPEGSLVLGTPESEFRARAEKAEIELETLRRALQAVMPGLQLAPTPAAAEPVSAAAPAEVKA